MGSDNYTLVDTWRLNNRVNLKLLDHLSEQQLAVAANLKARSVGDQFAHLHKVRCMWLEVSAPAALKGLAKIEKGKATKPLLKKALEGSSDAVAEMLAEAEKTGKVKGAKRGPVAFLGYMLAHEAHHRGQIILHLKNAKLPVDQSVGYGIWEWEKV